MLLKKFDVFGFKSFADKTQLEFNPGINAIVGPNGSGKSNLSDAIRWALGEQSIRSLRGTKLEDVIFSGSTQRRPLSIAEVSLTFDNYDSLLPLDFGEVTITRRVYRSGDSEYLINKTPCRLKDLQELLAGTGLGRESMALIGQNNIEEILNCKPEERRLLFEEVIGIARFKTRRKEAARKMEDTEHNLTRVRDLMAEIEGGLEPLRESSEKTTAYNRLYSRFVQCRSTVLYHRYSRNQARLLKIEQDETRAADLMIAASTQVSLSECDRELLLAETMNLDEQLLFYDRAVSANRLLTEKVEGAQRLAQERLSHFTQKRNRIAEDMKGLLERETTFASSLESAQQKLTALLGREEVSQQDMNALNETYEDRLRQMDELRQKTASARTLAFDRLQAVVDERNKLRDAQKEMESLHQRIARIDKQEQEATEEGRKLQERAAEQEEQISDHLKHKQAIQEQIRTNIVERDATQHLIIELRRKERDGGQKLQEAMSRNKVLASMQESFEGFSQGSRSVLKSQEAWSGGVIGPVAGLLTVPEKYVTAVETALGAALQFIVTKDEATSKAAIEFLKQRRAGRATFLPLHSIKPAPVREYENASAGAPGVVGLASSLVQVEAEYQVVVDMLLGRTIVATDMDSALRVARNSGQRLRIVTLDGELINPGGSITGGRTQQREQGFLGRQAELQELAQSITVLKKSADAVAVEMSAADEKLREKVRQDQELREKYSHAEIQRVETEGHLTRTKQDLRNLEALLANYRNESAQCRLDTSALQRQAEELQTTLEALKTAEETNKSNLGSWQKELEKMESEKTDFENRLTDLRLLLNDQNHQRQSLQSEIRRLHEERNRVKAENSLLHTEQTEIAMQEEAARSEIEATQEEKDELIGKASVLVATRESCFAQKGRMVSDLQRLDRSLRDVRKKQRDAEEALHGMRLEKTSCEYEVRSCIEQIRSQYGLELEAVEANLTEGTEEELGEEAGRCEAEIRELGPVNPAAVEEYRRTLDRYEFMKTQADDLSSAADSLRMMILDIDRTMAAKLKEGFDAIHAHFSDIFSRLFGGGNANLELTNPDSVLDSGIEILVQPPGKRRQNLALLSGGERALTVISLLFAFLAYRPAPFCVIDEIDSALDESNVRRFSEFLREYSRNSQFIVVTHRRGTMEVADILHGVTMEDSGVSRLVSVKFLNESNDLEQGRVMRGST